MEVLTWFKVEYKDSIGDHFDGKMSEKLREKLIKQHLQDYCDEHQIDRKDITIIKEERC